jgi:hypothetical protein
MATTETGGTRPGVSVGPTSEFSLFFRVKPGHGDALREALRTLQDHPGYRPGEYHIWKCGGRTIGPAPWTTGGGHAGMHKRADRSVMGMLVSTLGLLPAATAKAAAPPRWQTVAPKPPVNRDMMKSNTKLTRGVPGAVATGWLGAAALGGPQARALAFSRSNSDWSIAPTSSSSLALAICSAAVVSLVAATLRT